MTTTYEPVIGLEIHVQLTTTTKAFSGELTSFGDEPNINTSPVCLGLPGALPVINAEMVRMAVLVGLALNCEIREQNFFARKNYFYPDLPKGYQISQYEDPICENGWVEIDVEGTRKRIGITRVHMEEDAGKNLHESSDGTLLNYNRAGVPLLEIVSEPDITTPEEARAYMRAIREIVVYLGACHGNLEEGNLRCDGNVSVRPVGQQEFGTKTEVKNLNSYKFIKQALEYEIERQVEVIRRGGTIDQETRLFDPGAGVTRVLRTKEDAHDYRYFPEPDLPPLHLEKAFIDDVRRELPELPLAKQDRFMEQYGLPVDDAVLLSSTRVLADYYEEAVRHYPDGAKAIANWIMGELMRLLKGDEREFSADVLNPAYLAAMVKLIDKKIISGKIGKQVFEEMYVSGKDPDTIIDEKGLKAITDPEKIREFAATVIENNPNQVEQFKGGKEGIIGFLVGQVMKASKGKADPKITNEVLRELLKG